MLRTARLIAALALLSLLLASNARAQSVEDTKVGAINLSYVARMSKTGKEGLSRLDQASRKRAAQVEARAAELEKQQTDFGISSTGLSPRAIADLRRTFEKSKVDFERLQQDAQKEIEAMQAQFELEFRAKLAPVIDEISKEKGLHFVFGLEQAAIVWWSPTVDISDDVVKKLDAQK